MKTQSSTDLPSLKFDLPDPEEDGLSQLDFLERLENAWSICEQFDLQTEIWRGRILRVVRDREKRGGDGRGGRGGGVDAGGGGRGGAALGFVWRTWRRGARGATPGSGVFVGAVRLRLRVFVVERWWVL